ncbi:polysaccharide pyruvyl transferase family protein [Marinifilum sp. RC60d5]|uniref:polysaccharide pyruvyl transferase family protein n=1 Tax=Marinifilum sp. RC60d5 TaxID=3458414 RepID=UPI004035146A
MKTVGLFTSVFYNNIGNAFIDLGAEATLKGALSEEFSIVKLSQCPFFASSMSRGMALKESKLFHWLWVSVMQRFAKQLHDRSYSMVKSKDVFNLLDIVELDYLIIPGCVLTVPFFKIFGNALKKANSNGTKLIFLGASGNFYTDYEVKFVSSYLKELNPHAIMTRDSRAFEFYSSYSKHVFNGIDNAFFVNKIAETKVNTYNKSYVIINFDEPKHKSIKDKCSKEFKNVIFTNHKPYPYSNIKKLSEKGIMVSDTPLDYLLLYANASEVHSDRVHACIPALSFGNKCKLYSDSPRIALFENAGLSDITEKVVSIDGLKEKQDCQMDFLRSVLK